MKKKRARRPKTAVVYTPGQPRKNMSGWARKMTHPAYATVPEMAMWLDKPRETVNRCLKKSGLLYYDRARSYKFPNGTRKVKWYIVPPTTFRSFLLCKAHRLWEETMAEFPLSERTISPYAAYAGLLKESSSKPVTPSLPWPFRRPTLQNAAWKKLKMMRRKRPSRASRATSS